ASDRGVPPRVRDRRAARAPVRALNPRGGHRAGRHGERGPRGGERAGPRSAAAAVEAVSASVPGRGIGLNSAAPSGYGVTHMVRKIHHVGIVVESLGLAYRFWRNTLGLPPLREAEIADQGVRAALLAPGDSEVELL